ncbi:MAG: molybdate ABC transporter substrate-binding protein [Anaerococcus sp.]|nr:molybdate ABC transporter substrate-binding protein [Anaerococcus sp.]
MNFKKIGLTLLVGMGALSLIACGNTNEDVSEKPSEKKSITVFAAASMTDVMEELKEIYIKDQPGIDILYNFDSSGTLKTQIEEGAEVDIFISAAQKQMNELDKGHEAYNNKVSIDPSSRFDLLENKVTLVVSGENPNGLSDFKDLASDKVESLALGNEDVPVGQYSLEILNNLGIYEKVMPKVSLGSNVREVATWVNEGAVDAGIIYATDAKIFGLEVVDQAGEEELDTRVIYPAARLENSPNKDEADKFLEFLKTKKASEIFEKYGFSPIK